MTHEEQQKRCALYSVCRVDNFNKINKLNDTVFTQYYEDCCMGRYYTEYYLILNHHEHDAHMRECYSLERCRGKSGYDLFMYHWQYLGVSGHNYVYRLIQWRNSFVNMA